MLPVHAQSIVMWCMLLPIIEKNSALSLSQLCLFQLIVFIVPTACPCIIVFQLCVGMVPTQSNARPAQLAHNV